GRRVHEEPELRFDLAQLTDGEPGTAQRVRRVHVPAAAREAGARADGQAQVDRPGLALLVALVLVLVVLLLGPRFRLRLAVILVFAAARAGSRVFLAAGRVRRAAARAFAAAGFLAAARGGRAATAAFVTGQHRLLEGVLQLGGHQRLRELDVGLDLQ